MVGKPMSQIITEKPIAYWVESFQTSILLLNTPTICPGLRISTSRGLKQCPLEGAFVCHLTEDQNPPPRHSVVRWTLPPGSCLHVQHELSLIVNAQQANNVTTNLQKKTKYIHKPKRGECTFCSRIRPAQRAQGQRSVGSMTTILLYHPVCFRTCAFEESRKACGCSNQIAGTQNPHSGQIVKPLL